MGWNYFLNRSSNALRASFGRIEVKPPEDGACETVTAVGARILLYGRAERIKGAVVSSILFGNALWYRPGAFKLRRGVKVRTLLAAMKLKTAARTTAVGVKTLLQNGAAI